MKLIRLLLVVALVVPFMSCDSLSLEDPKVVKLERQLAELTKERDNLAKTYNDLVTVNRALIAEKKLLSEENRQLKEAGGSLMTTVAQMDTEQTASPWPPSKGDKLTFRIDFEHNQLYNRKDSKEIARMIMAYNKATDGNIKITIEGYSSMAGPVGLNKWFSKERAEGVMFKIYEAFNSSDPLNIEVIAHGETDDDERKVIVTVEVL